ncbi:hypothetical protein EMCRGX_G015940 [Ephydatia muelleri]
MSVKRHLISLDAYSGDTSWTDWVDHFEATALVNGWDNAAKPSGLQKKDVIQPSSSPSVSLIVVVQKKDGSYRFCVDYRKINKITRKDAYPLPRIDVTIEVLSGSQCMVFHVGCSMGLLASQNE